MPTHVGSSADVTSPSGTGRKALVDAAFQGLDARDAGSLGCSDLLRFARVMGFNGDEAEWRREYLTISTSLGTDPKAGLDCKAFSHLVNDNALGCFCTAEDLQCIAAASQQVQVAEPAVG